MGRHRKAAEVATSRVSPLAPRPAKLASAALPMAPANIAIPPKHQEEMDRLLTQCVPHGLIRRHMAQKFNISKSRVDRYIHEVYRRWSLMPGVDRPARKEQMRQALMDAYTTSRAQGKMSAAVSALDRLCVLDGLYDAERIEIEGTVVGVSADSLMANDPNRVRARIVELYDRFKRGGGAALGRTDDAAILSVARPADETVGAGGEGSLLVDAVTHDYVQGE